MSNFVVWQRCLIVMQFAHPLIAIVKLYEQLLNYWAIVKLCTPLHNRHIVFCLLRAIIEEKNMLTKNISGCIIYVRRYDGY